MEYQNQGNPTPLSKIITVASLAAGVQFGWALQLSLLTPYVQTLGVPHTWAAFVWLCGPLSGLLVQPTVGYYSDRCTSRLGRRRPFIIGGAAMVGLAVFLIGFAKDIGYKSGDDINKATKPRAVAIFVVGFWLLDVANNTLQGPCRALLADLCSNEHKKMRMANSFYSFFMALGNVLGYAAGSYSKLYTIFPFTETEVCHTACANLKSCFIIDIVLLILIAALSASTISEIPYVPEENNKEKDVAQSLPFFGELVASFKHMEKSMWILLLVTCFNWIAWFPYVLYSTDWMGRDVYGGSPDGTKAEKDIYDLGVRAGALGLMLNSIILGIVSLIVEPMGQLVGGVKRLWGIVNIILACGLASMVIVAETSESWRSVHGLLSPPMNIKGGALGIFSILGIPLAITYSIPFALASIYCSLAGGGQGLSLGVVNLAIVFPQILVSVVSGPLDSLFGGGNSPALVFGAICALISSVLSFTVLPNPPTNATSPTMVLAGGGH